MDSIDFSTIFTGLGYGAAYTGAGLVLLALGYWVLDLLTPGHLGTHLLRGGDRGGRPDGLSDALASQGAGTVAAAWMLAQAAIIFTAIWTNGDSSFGQAFVSAVLFGLLGIVLLTVAFVLLDVLTPGRLGDAVIEPGGITPLARLTAAALLGIAAIVCASIA
jgi:Domain of Unknown Function (DUF350)